MDSTPTSMKFCPGLHKLPPGQVSLDTLTIETGGLTEQKARAMWGRAIRVGDKLLMEAVIRLVEPVYPHLIHYNRNG